MMTRRTLLRGAGVALGPFGLGALQGELPWLRYVTMKSSASMDQLGCDQRASKAEPEK